jgi:hypothetical protein
MPKAVKTVTGYVKRIAKIPRNRREIVVFRGHPDKSYALLPSVLRSTHNKRREHLFVRELIAEHPQEFQSDQTMLERLARMQHYSLPTRLLDLTANPLVALYFACSEQPRKPAEVMILTVSKNLIKYYDSDTASCIANLAQLSPLEKRRINPTALQATFNNATQVQRLVQFVREEKPYFKPEIVAADLSKALFVKPKFNSRRIAAQAGAFLLFGLRNDLASQPERGITIERISIAAADKVGILKELAILGFNESTLFPEIESAARHIRSRV